MKIIPSILTHDPNEARELLGRCEGVVDGVSIDIIDGKFADNKTISPDMFFDVETNLKLEYQLMVIEPVNWIEKCICGQADRIIGHIEHMTSQKDFVGKVQKSGREVGLALDLTTPISRLDTAILQDVNVVLLMSVPAGFGGQKFHIEVLDKVRELNEIRARDKTPFLIQDDGGIVFEYIDDIRREAVDEVSVGRRLFDGDLKKNIDLFVKASFKT